ncbi:hypothetical protein M2347_000644 [Chryseobacterium sp. H1D6B]|uniref:helix-turn-helix domain-containing protein n=1 Tax=Chryseobacterium sp. H1D6B TaxID=2940588 RepID=UPI0015C73969|nr:helix-turn-helix domain-containing protein [Chryseobacterium sp. H1D6B]MDH6250917.1 hypothetical protein [Chryseobacterium sp. H1D6B]
MKKRTNLPDYKRIYSDIIEKKYPHMKDKCQSILKKESLFVLDIIKLNTLIFGIKNKETMTFNQRHRSYDYKAIIEILNYQNNNKLNNTQTALHFKLSRNTVTKWKKTYLF